MPPLIPAAKLRPVGPSTTTRPPVMYSQPWSPTPSTTATAPEFRTAKRSPASPGRTRARKSRRTGRCCRRSRSPRRRRPRPRAARTRGRRPRGPCRRSRSRADERQLDPGRKPGAERLARAPAELEVCTVALEAGARPWSRAGRRPCGRRSPPRPRRLPSLAAALDQLPVERVVERRDLRPRCGEAACPAGTSGAREHVARSTPRACQCVERRRRPRADRRDRRARRRADAERGQQLAHVLGDVQEVLDRRARACRERRRSSGPGSRCRSGTCSGGRRAITQPWRPAAPSRSRTLGAEQRGDHDVAARLQPAVGPHPDTRAQAVQHEHLLGLREPDLPRDAGVLDGGERRRARAAVVAGDEDVVGVAFATPAATVPTPTSATSFTETRAAGFAQLRS